MTSAQCRAARTLLGRTQSDLAVQAHCALVTVKRAEAGQSRVIRTSISALHYAFKAAGVDFSVNVGDGENVRIKDTRLVMRGGDWPRPVFGAEEQGA